MDKFESLPYSLGVQISCRVHPQVSPEDVIRRVEGASWGGVPETSLSEGESGRGRAPAARPCSYAVVDSAKALGLAGGGVHQGQERHSSGKGLRRTEAQLRWAALLGARVLRLDGRA